MSNIDSQILLFADDTCLYKSLTNPIDDIQRLNGDLTTLSDWASQWLVNFNPAKTKFMIFSKKTPPPQYSSLYLNGKKLVAVTSHKQLGLIFNSNMTWDDHIQDRCNKAMMRVTLLKRIALRVPPITKLSIYISFIRPLLEYCSVIFDSCSANMSDMLENVQRQAALSITGAYTHTSHTDLFAELGLPLLTKRRKMAKLILLHKIINGQTPTYLRDILPPVQVRNYNTRQGDNTLTLPIIKKNYMLKSFIPSTIRLWNELDNRTQNISDLENFRIALLSKFSPEKPYKPYLLGYDKEYVYLARLRMGLSGLNAHRRRYHFIENGRCPNCLFKIEDTLHFVLHCPSYAAHRAEMLDHLSPVFPAIKNDAQSRLRKVQKNVLKNLIFGMGNESVDRKIFEHVAQYVKNTKRFM